MTQKDITHEEIAAAHAEKAAAKKPVKKAAKKAAHRTAHKTAKKAAGKAAHSTVRNFKTVSNDEMFQFSKNNKHMENMMYQGKDQFDKYTQEATRARKEHADAVMESGNIFMKGSEDLYKTWLNWVQKSAERNSEAMKELLGCRTLNEFAVTQSRIAQENFDEFVSGATRVSERSVKLATETFEPMAGQLNKNIRKAEKRAA